MRRPQNVGQLNEAQEGRIPHVQVGEEGILFDRTEVQRVLLTRASLAPESKEVDDAS